MLFLFLHPRRRLQAAVRCAAQAGHAATLRALLQHHSEHAMARALRALAPATQGQALALLHECERERLLPAMPAAAQPSAPPQAAHAPQAAARMTPMTLLCWQRP